MKRALLLLLLVLGLAGTASAQLGNTVTTGGSGAPPGGGNQCSVVSFYVDQTAGTLYDCKNGVWNSVGGGGGGGGAPAGSMSEVQINGGGGMFGAIPGLLGNIADCDGFTDGCKLQSNINEAASGVPYMYCRTITDGAAGNYVCLTGADDGMGGPVNIALQAYDGVNFATLTVNSTGVVPFPNINSRLYEYPTYSGGTNCPTTTICEHAPAGLAATYEVVKPPLIAQGTLFGRLENTNVITQGNSGDSEHSVTVTIGSATSIGSTEFCGSSVCIDGVWRVNGYINMTTPCGTTGTYLVNLIYTGDGGVVKTVPLNIQGTGAVPATGILTTTSTDNFGQASQIIRLASGGMTGINYSTTAVACGTGGPMVGKLYLSAEPVQ